MIESAAAGPPSFVEAVGRRAIALGLAVREAVAFLGRITIAVPQVFRERGMNLRRREFGLAVQEAGAETLPLVGLVSFAMGSVLALVGIPQLDRLGAPLVAPNLVAIVVLRELGALATGICLAGRLGSASAAEIATHVSMAHPPGTRADVDEAFDELVIPRVVALALMGPLLVIYANALALLGSVTVGVGLMDITAVDYLERTQAALTFRHAAQGLIKGACFGMVVAMAGSYHGLRSGSRPAAVGRSVRRAVVSAVLGVVLVDVALTLFFNWVRI